MAIVIRPGEDVSRLNSEALRLRAAQSQRVSLQSGENVKLDLLMPVNK
jgi:hypothetical protein